MSSASRIGYLSYLIFPDISEFSLQLSLTRFQVLGLRSQAIKLHGSELDFAYSTLQLCMNAPAVESSSKKQLDVNSILSGAQKMSAFCGARIARHRLAPSPISGAYIHEQNMMKKRSRKNRTVCFPGSVSPYLMQLRSQPKSATLRHEFWQNTRCLTFCSRGRIMEPGG